MSTGPGAAMPGAAAQRARTGGQRAEVRLRSMEYDMWACGRCDARVVVPHDGPLPFDRCPGCTHRTVREGVRTVRPATVQAVGLAEVTRTCLHCDWRTARQRRTARLADPAIAAVVGFSGAAFGGASSSSSDCGSSGSSSFGGDGGTSGGGGGSSY